MKNILCLLVAISMQFSMFAQFGTTRAIFDQSSIGEIRMEFKSKNWSDQMDSMRLYGKSLLPGTVIIDGIPYEDAGVRFRGNSSYQLGFKRNPFQIKLDYTANNVNHQGYSTFKLSSSLRDPSMIREALFLEVASKYIPAPKYSFTKLYINGEYIGIFVNIEPVDDKMLSDNFGVNSNPLYKAGVEYPDKDQPNGCKSGIFANLEYEQNLACYKNNFEAKNGANWSDLQALTLALDRNPKQIDELLDVDNILWNLALNNVMVNLSSYIGKNSQNFYLYKNAEGKFCMIPWDLNLAFGSYKNTGSGSDLILKQLQRLEPLLHEDNPYKPLVSKLLSDPLRKKIYLSHVRQIYTENFKNNWYQKRARELQGMIVVPFSEDPYKIYNLDEFQTSLTTTIGKRSKIPGIVELMDKRSRFLQNLPDLTALPSTITDIHLKERGKFSKESIKGFHIIASADRFPKRMTIHYRAKNTVQWLSMDMDELSDEKNSNGVKSFEAKLKLADNVNTIEYYIMAENAGAVSFSPENYTQKPNTISLEELNK